MSGYIVNENETFETFLRTKRILLDGKFPVVAKFLKMEASLIIETVKRLRDSNKRIIEMGCGSGRLLEELRNKNFVACGFDNDKLYVKYCKKRKLDVFYGDAIKKLSPKLKGKFKIVIIGFNTLFNFNKNLRKKWINNAKFLLEKGGSLIFTVYADNKITRTGVRQRVEFYKESISPKNGYIIRFSPGKSRIEMVYRNKTVWFSEWKTKNEIEKEIKSREGFKLKSIKLLDGKIAYFVELLKS